MPIHAGPRGAPDPAHAGQTIGPAACGRDGPAHGRDLRRAKGRLASKAAILASSNSRSSSISPSFAFRRSVSSASPSVGRVARLASPADTKVSCHPVRVAAVTPRARERISRSSPRSRRRTASRLRWRDMRPPRPKPTPSEAVVCVFIVTLLRITSAYRVSQRTGERTTLDEARRRAQATLAELYRGVDPRVSARGCATLCRVLNDYLASRPLRETTKEEYRRGVERHLKAWLDRPLKEVTPEMVEARHRAIAEE